MSLNAFRPSPRLPRTDLKLRSTVAFERNEGVGGGPLSLIYNFRYDQFEVGAD